MNPDGTVNRAALPAIYNPEDLSALEFALDIKDRFGGTVTVVTMGLPAATEILRQSLYRGGDRAILVTDRRCAASDTLATSYILSCAIRKLDYDIVLCGRQAIDGDTAQVGPQLAEKLGIPQVTYVEELIELTDSKLVAKRNTGSGWQEVKATMPLLLTVIEEANEPRVPAAKKLMKFKNAQSAAQIGQQIRQANNGADDDAIAKLVDKEVKSLDANGLLIEQWDLDYLQADLQWCGRDGSPTKVHRIQSVVLEAKGSKEVEATEAGVSEMVHELIEGHTIG